MSLRRFSLLLALLITGVATKASAQESDIIRGRVLGPDSVPLENVKVSAMSISSSQTLTRNTDKTGRFTIIFSNGGGDFIVSYTAIGFQPAQKEVKREQDEGILIADMTLGKNATMLTGIVVRANRERVNQNDQERYGAGVGSGDRGVDMSQLAIGSQGDLAAMAASLPGVTYIPGADGGAAGFSILGLGADQNLTTLNGLNFGGSDLPRDATTTARVSGNSYSPLQGGFSGGQLSLRTSPGTNFITQSVHFTSEPSVTQFVDQAGQQLGVQYNNFTASGAWRGPIAMDKLYFASSIQGSRRQQGLQTLDNTDALGLAALGISADSVEKLKTTLLTLGIPVAGSVPNDRLTDAASGILQLDWTASAGHNFTFTTNASWNRSQAAGLSTRQVPTNGGETERINTALQARHSSYFGNGFLDETNAAIQFSQSKGSPYVSLPDANVRIASTFADGTTGSVQTLTVGGNPSYPTDSRTFTFQSTNSTNWISMDNKHKFTLNENFGVNTTRTDNSRNRLGTYTYLSLADFQNGKPSSFTRLLNPLVRTGRDVQMSFALADTYRPTQRLQIGGGPRVDILHFNVQPTLNDSLVAKLGIRNDHVPAGIFISPRIGFSYGFGTNSTIGGFAGAARGTKYQISGGVGKFQNIPNSSLVSTAVDNTGLPTALQSLTCTGAAVPVVDWNSYNDPNNIPSTCAGAPTVFSNNSPNVSLFTDGYTPQTSWRTSLSFGGPILKNAYRIGINGTFSYNLHQQGTVDLNFNNQIPGRFTLPAEGGRPVYVDPTSIVTTTGSIGSKASRIVSDYSRVTAYTSDLRSVSKQLQFSLSPMNLVNVHYSWSLAYVLQSVRDQQRGFNGNTAGDPFVAEWGRSSGDSRHAFQGSFRYTFANAVTFSTGARLSSGTPFSPIVSGDVNGDGTSNDRAFIFNPATMTPVNAADTAFKTGYSNMLASTPMKDCLMSQIGSVAARNSCQAPWYFNVTNMQISFVSTAVHLPQRATLRIGMNNILTGVDLLAHGSDNLHGWGQQPNLESTVYYVRGFDPATKTYKYEVNPRFGNSRLTNAGSRNPFMLTFDVVYDVGPEREKQQLNMNLRDGRRGDVTKQKMNEQQLFQRYQNSLQNPFQTILNQMDTLQLTTDQADSLAVLNKNFSRARDEIWRPVSKYLAGLPDDYNINEAWDKVKSAQNALLDKMIILGPAAKQLLTKEQLNRLPANVMIFMDEQTIRAWRPGNTNGRGRVGGG